MQMKKLLAILPAWLLVGTILVMGSGCTWGHCWTPRTCCGPEIDIDQENYGNGHYRTNYAQANITNGGGWGWYGGGGGEIEIDQENHGDGNYRDNLAFADIENGGYGGGWGGWGAGCDSEIDIDQENYGNGNYRDNVAYATWTW